MKQQKKLNKQRKLVKSSRVDEQQYKLKDTNKGVSVLSHERTVIMLRDEKVQAAVRKDVRFALKKCSKCMRKPVTNLYQLAVCENKLSFCPFQMELHHRLSITVPCLFLEGITCFNKMVRLHCIQSDEPRCVGVSAICDICEEELKYLV